MSPGGAIALKSAGGTVVTIGDFRAAGASAASTTWGDPIRYADPGIPLSMYQPGMADPLHIWKTQPSVRKVVGYAAREIAAVPWHGYQRKSDTDRERKAAGRAEKLLNAPSKFRTGYHLWETVVIDKLMYDRWCVMFWAGDGSPKNPDRLVRIPPKLLEIKSNFLGEATEVIMKNPQAGEPDVDLTDAPIAIGWGWSDGAAGGISPMTTLNAILQENRRAIEWRENMWENGPKISGLLKHPGQFKSGENRERFLQSWREWKNSQQAGGTPLLENGMEYQQLESVTPKDARDIEGRTLTDLEVCGAFHIPPELVGARPANFSNMQALRTMLYGPVLGPIFSEIHQAVNAGLLPHLDASPRAYVEQAREKATQGSVLEQAKVYQALVGGPVLTVNEARAEMNRPAVPGGDELIVPMNVTQGGQANPQDSGTQNENLEDTPPESEPEA
ncbi:portal protein [Arthrobacter phage Shambre1]|uniref:Portal protein n=1 Tax=Arthrobacter phage Shambre1 TaxID=2927284 RepID=A0A977KNJ5_9CAUD|nr:portal protein [Arthrobacter phage Shambre1]UXE04742.1 portal protein [Arthrobacter phage Shambre1]